MDSIISGTFRMIIRRGFPHQLYFDEDFMRIIGTEDNSDPEKNYRLWEECVHPDDMPLIKEAIESTQHNIRAEVKYRWRHKTRGLYTAYSTGMLAGKEDGCVTIYGFFKGVPADRTQLYGYDPDLQLLTRLLAEKMVDTYNVLKSGVPNAIKAFDNVLKPLGKRPCGIRLDSGDIAYLSREARKMLDEAGYPDCKIVASNSLDERIISDLLRQGAAIDLFGVGERLITASSEPVFGGVYKLAAVEENGVITPKIKISENVSKITNPHFKKLYRIYESNGKAIADQLCVYDETIDPSKPLTLFDPDFTWKKKTLTDFTVRELHVPVFKNGELVYDKPSLQDIRSYCKQQIDTLWDEVLRFENPHNYYVDLSRKLWDIKHELLDNGGVLRARDGRERS